MILLYSNILFPVQLNMDCLFEILVLIVFISLLIFLRQGLDVWGSGWLRACYGDKMASGSGVKGLKVSMHQQAWLFFFSPKDIFFFFKSSLQMLAS